MNCPHCKNEMMREEECIETIRSDQTDIEEVWKIVWQCQVCGHIEPA